MGEPRLVKARDNVTRYVPVDRADAPVPDVAPPQIPARPTAGAARRFHGESQRSGTNLATRDQVG